MTRVYRVASINKQGGFGRGVIERLAKTSVKRNLYYEIKEKVIEEAFNGYRVNKNKRLVKVYGLDSTKDVRARLIEILYERVAYHKDKFIAPILHQEMSTMVTKKSGKVEHALGHHDDSVFSYLMALYVWYDGKNIAENWGVQKNTIKTDEDIEIVEGDIDQQIDTESLDINDKALSFESNDPEISAAMEFVKEASRFKTMQQFKVEQFDDEDRTLNELLANNKPFREAYGRRYNTDTTSTSIQNTMTTLPEYAFLDADEDEVQEYMYTQKFGNLRKTYDKLNL